MRKGQIITMDFIPALMIFLAIFTGLLLTWNTTTTQIEEINMRNNMERAAVLSADTMVRHEGEPDDWGTDNVTVIGLADGEPNVLSEDKVADFMDLSYDEARDLMGIPREFHWALNRTDGTVFTADGEDTVFGNVPDDADNVIVVRRFVMFKDEVGIMKVRVWE